MRNLLLYIILCTQTIVLGQVSPNGRTFIDDKVVSVAIDPLQQIYYTNTKKQLIKISNQIEKTYSYSDLMIDEHTSVIPQNPFKIILYKKEVGDFLVLDNRLNLSAKVNLFDLGYFSVTSLTVANDNKHLWVFDFDRQQIIKLDQQYNTVFQSNILTQILGKKINAIQLIEKEDKLYLLDNKNGVYIFDNMGNYIKNYPIENAEKIWLISGQIYFYRDEQIWQYDTQLFQEVLKYNMQGYTSIDICRDFILGITPNGELYQQKWE
ncbi:MAG: hypothetical protein M9958_01415 [Chitinophagales bacterium]|nr:hypothetical protein [Chitinophagales bacterium]